MIENVLNDALMMADGGEELPPFIDSADVEEAAISYATWAFEAHQTASEAGLATDESFVELINKACAAAFIARQLAQFANQPEVTTQVVGKSGAIYNFYFN